MNDKIAKYVQDMQEQIDFFNKKENRDKFVEYIESLRKEIERLNKESEQLRTALNSKERIIKEVRNQLDYLETYSSKEDVFEDMKRRLDRIDKIIGSDKE